LIMLINCYLNCEELHGRQGSEENQFTPPSPSRSRFGRAMWGWGK
jgi:hypothetical protein